MECHSSDSKKILKVFDASKRARNRKKRAGPDDSNSIATDDSATVNGHRIGSAKASLQNVTPGMVADAKPGVTSSKRDHDSSPSVSPVDPCRSSRSPRRHRRLTRDGISLALKAGLVSTPRSMSPRQVVDEAIESIPQDQDSFIYAFLEEAVKRDKRKHRHARRHEEKRASRDRDASEPREHRHCHRRHRDEPARTRDRDRDKYAKEVSQPPAIDQTALLETFAKLCAQFNEKSTPAQHAETKQIPRTQSHKSLQCEVVSRRGSYNVTRPQMLHGQQVSRENISPSRIRSHDHFHSRNDNLVLTGLPDDCKSQCCHTPYEKDLPKYASKLNVLNSRIRNSDPRYQEYPHDRTPPRSCVDNTYYKPHLPPNRRDYADYDDHREPTRERPYEDRKVYCEQKTSRSFDVHREGYDDRACRRTVRSDCNREKLYGDPREYREKRYDVASPRDKYYDSKPSKDRNFNVSSKERHFRRNLDRFERISIASREDDYRERYSEKERDSGLSVADGETSTMSGRSNCLRVVKQEISEQREAMDKMMKLWKELMRCFKGISQTQGQDKAVQDSAENVRESAAAQLRLWRECMRRYETVARDVGDTDARLMEEINKQRSEMAEMANMWQECLQRYRDMSNDFNSLKQQLTTPESRTRMPPAPLVCAEGEGAAPATPYRLPTNYPTMAPPQLGGAYPSGGSPLRPRASAPPAWWWAADARGPAPPPRRRSSPDSRGSRGSRDRRHRHRDRDRDDSKYKEKTKAGGARSEHRHRKR